MTDLQKVLMGLDCCERLDSEGINDPACEDCPYAEEGGTCENLNQLLDDCRRLITGEERGGIADEAD